MLLENMKMQLKAYERKAGVRFSQTPAFFAAMLIHLPL
jgi:hypothetical protein